LDLLETAAIAARRLDRQALLSPNPPSDTKSDEVILVTTYEPSQDLLRNITKENWGYLGKSPLTTSIHQKKIMVGYRRPKNLRDILVRADCSIKRKCTKKTTIPTRALETGPNDTQTPQNISRRPRNKQSSIQDFVTRNNSPQILLSSSTSVGNLTGRVIATPIRSSSLTSLAKPNLMRNKCLAKQTCHYCPLLNKSSTITCHITGKKFITKKNITCRSSNLVYCITCKTCDKPYVGQNNRTILE